MVLIANEGTVTAGAVQFWIALGGLPATKPAVCSDSWQTTCRASVSATVESALLVATYSAALREADSIVSQAW